MIGKGYRLTMTKEPPFGSTCAGCWYDELDPNKCPVRLITDGMECANRNCIWTLQPVKESQ